MGFLAQIRRPKSQLQKKNNNFFCFLKTYIISQQLHHKSGATIKEGTFAHCIPTLVSSLMKIKQEAKKEVGKEEEERRIKIGEESGRITTRRRKERNDEEVDHHKHNPNTHLLSTT